MCLGIPGQIIEITNINHKLATVNIAGVKRQVNIACIVDEQHPPEACIGDWVLVHVGFAMNRINEQQAAETLQLLEELIGNREEDAGTRGHGDTGTRGRGDAGTRRNFFPHPPDSQV